MNAAVGAALLALHAAALPVLLDRCQRDELEVRGGEVPASIRDGVTVDVDGAPPGLVRTRWTIAYRGGFTRSVGAATLVGPFQDPAAPGCGGRLVIGQRFLDEQVAPTVAAALADELRGYEQFPAGAFRRVARTKVRWADDGLRVQAAIELDRVTADVTVTVRPRIEETRLRFAVAARAKLRVDSAVVAWAIDALDLDDHASDVVKQELDDAILDVFDPPPPLVLSGDRTLRVGYCAGGAITYAPDAWAALPLALHFEAGPGVLPPRLGPTTPPAPAPGAAIAFDLDLDTINALLHELWRTGFLDEQLDAAALDRRFNEDPTVVSLLTLRVSPLRLAAPPVVSAGPRGLRMAADLRVHLADRGAITPARVWATLDVDLDPATADPTVALAELELTCEPAPDVLRPCYADLVTAMRDRAGDARAELSAVLVEVMRDLFTARRLAAPEAPAELVLDAPRLTSHVTPANGTITIALQARLEPIR